MEFDQPTFDRHITAAWEALKAAQEMLEDDESIQSDFQIGQLDAALCIIGLFHPEVVAEMEQKMGEGH